VRHLPARRDDATHRTGPRAASCRCPSIAKAWESFLSGKGMAEGALRDLVDRSWQRCA
jgi:hypothetical protein